MREEYLHFLWRMKRLNFNKLQLVNGSKLPVIVKDVGWYNLDAGPDFFNGTAIIDGIQWSGNIEIHIKSSDWYAHKHHLDRTYDNVILHVVYEHDREVMVNGKPIPTIELKNLINKRHLQYYSSLVDSSNYIPCHKEVMQHHLALLQQIDISFINRIERKGLALFEGFEEQIISKNELFYVAVLKAVGGRANRLPMQQLSKYLSYKIIEKEKWEATRLDALLFGVAGFLKEECDDHYFKELHGIWKFLKNKYQLVEMNPKAWKFNGIRPYSFPTLLLVQLSAFFQQIEIGRIQFHDSDFIIEKINRLHSKKIHPYWRTHFLFGRETKERNLHFSKLFQNNLLINGVIPFLVALKHLKNDYIFADVAVELAEKLSPERNKVMNYWKAIGFQPKNVLESQGLLELNNEFCNFKKCLSCKVGSTILENEKINSENSILF
ncbi:MAG: DUF2851 family protein [Brumimicrobium sp.]